MACVWDPNSNDDKWPQIAGTCCPGSAATNGKCAAPVTPPNPPTCSSLTSWGTCTGADSCCWGFSPQGSQGCANSGAAACSPPAPTLTGASTAFPTDNDSYPLARKAQNCYLSSKGSPFAAIPQSITFDWTNWTYQLQAPAAAVIDSLSFNFYFTNSNGPILRVPAASGASIAYQSTGPFTLSQKTYTGVIDFTGDTDADISALGLSNGGSLEVTVVACVSYNGRQYCSSEASSTISQCPDGVDKLLLGNVPSPVGSPLNPGQFYPTVPFMFSSQQITLGSTPASSGFYPAIIPDFIYTKCYRTPAAPGATNTDSLALQWVTDVSKDTGNAPTDTTFTLFTQVSGQSLSSNALVHSSFPYFPTPVVKPASGTFFGSGSAQGSDGTGAYYATLNIPAGASSVSVYIQACKPIGGTGNSMCMTTNSVTLAPCGDNAFPAAPVLGSTSSGANIPGGPQTSSIAHNRLPYPTGSNLPMFMSSVTTSVNCYPSRPAPVAGSKDAGFTLSFNFGGNAVPGPISVYLFGTGGVTTAYTSTDFPGADAIEPLSQALVASSPNAGVSYVFGAADADSLDTQKYASDGSNYYMRFGTTDSLKKAAGSSAAQTKLTAVVCVSSSANGNLCSAAAPVLIGECPTNPLNGGVDSPICSALPDISSGSLGLSRCFDDTVASGSDSLNVVWTDHTRDLNRGTSTYDFVTSLPNVAPLRISSPQPLTTAPNTFAASFPVPSGTTGAFELAVRACYPIDATQPTIGQVCGDTDAVSVSPCSTVSKCFASGSSTAVSNILSCDECARNCINTVACTGYRWAASADGQYNAWQVPCPPAPPR